MAFAAAIAIVAACGERHPSTAEVMQHNLSEMRKAIRDFRVDQHRPPTTLKELVPRYIASIPNDPVTGAADWQMVTEEPARLNEFRRALPLVASGIVDVRSAAPGTDANGKPWWEY